MGHKTVTSVSVGMAHIINMLSNRDNIMQGEGYVFKFEVQKSNIIREVECEAIFGMKHKTHITDRTTHSIFETTTPHSGPSDPKSLFGLSSQQGTLQMRKTRNFNTSTEYFSFLRRIKVLRASYSQSSSQFSDNSIGRQCAAITMVALAFSERHAVQMWTKNDLDLLITIGDRVYQESHVRLDQGRNHNYHTLDEIKKDIEIRGTKYIVGLSNEIQHHVELTFGVLQIIEGLEEFFKNRSKGALLYNNFFISVYKDSEYFYVFDSHSRNAFGMVSNSVETGVRIQFMNISDMAELIYRNFNYEDAPPSKGISEFRSNVATNSDGEPRTYVLYPIDVQVL